ncbi:nitrilase-related carbon-nitrogen hydrolase [Bradyrhizobium sp. USDA 4451]
MTTHAFEDDSARVAVAAPACNQSLLWLIAGAFTSMFAVGGRWDIALAAWVAPVFLLRFVRINRLRVAIPAIWLASLANALFWAIELNDRAMTAPDYAIAIVFGAVFALPYVADRILTPHLGVLGKLLAFPAAWACTEYLVATLSPLGGMYGLRANTQTEYLSVLQLTSVLGPYSIGFLINWFATTVNWMWERPRDSRRRSVAIAYGTVLGVVLIGGGLRLAFTPTPKAYVRMATITPSMYAQNAARAMIEGRSAAPNSYADPMTVMHANTLLFANKSEVARAPTDLVRAAYSLVQDDLLRSTREAAWSGAKVVLWSETAAPILSDADKSAFLVKIADVARSEKIFIDAAIGEPFARNQSELIGPDGKEIWSYDKRHPVPLLEPVAPGTRPAPTAQTPFGRLTNVICFDADFPSQSRVDADVMLVPGFEWPEIGSSHTLKWVRVRAIENGYALTVSTMPMSQLVMRLPTISRAGIA